METLQYCVQARAKLSQIKGKAMPTVAKIMLLESLKYRLKQRLEYQQNHRDEKSKQDLSSLNTTYFSQTRSIMCREEEQTLIDQILKKQKLKIEMDQEIETCQDDMSQIQKVVQTKQAYTEQLDHKIAKKSKQLQQFSIKQSKLQKVKSTPSLLQKIFG